MSLSFKERTIRTLKGDFDYTNKIDGYLHLERNKTDSIVKTIKTNLKPSDNPVSELHLSYLDALIQFCVDKGKKVILVRSPQHELASDFANEKTYQTIRQTRYKNIEYLDFSKFPLLNSQYGDLEHLNHKGAKKFSIWFATLLNNGLLSKKDKQVYINEMMAF